jgi:hypothetical protein
LMLRKVYITSNRARDTIFFMARQQRNIQGEFSD